MGLNTTNSTNDFGNQWACPFYNYLTTESTNSALEEFLWISASVISTAFNFTAVLSIIQKSPLQHFDVCLVNYSFLYLLHGNVLFISLALFSTRGQNCTLIMVVVAEFLMLSFAKLVIFIMINANQIDALREMRMVHPQNHHTLKKPRKLFILSLPWVLSGIAAAISLLSKHQLVPIVALAFFGKLTLVLRVCVMIFLRKMRDQASSTMKRTLLIVKKSMRVLSFLIIIEICAWLPSVVAALLYAFGLKSIEQLHTMNWCLKILFLTPLFYPFAVLVSKISNYVPPCQLCLDRCKKAENETEQN